MDYLAIYNSFENWWEEEGKFMGGAFNKEIAFFIYESIFRRVGNGG